MALTGILRSWNAERGFGFIAPTHGGAELFVHISAFPKDGTHPVVGETLSYELGRGPDGRPQATKVIRSAIGVRPLPAPRAALDARPPPAPRAARAPQRQRKPLGGLVAILLVVSLGAFGYDKYRQHVQRLTLEHAPQPAIDGAPLATPPTSSFHCDGRIHCSQMTSCAEATWFLNNCPGTKMDGNHDGVPCEQQWCGGGFAR